MRLKHYKVDSLKMQKRRQANIKLTKLNVKSKLLSLFLIKID